ncbi:MAG: methylated-DNA--[protein]-cysteine S-methyltransferase [Rufibacter sp.]
MAPTVAPFLLHMPTPLGTLVITSTATHVVSISFAENSPETPGISLPDCLLQARQQLQEYFEGTRQTFDLPLQEHGTAFQKNVWQALVEIPAGRTEPYLGLATRLGNARAVRAVGLANGANPWAVVIPCHRVIGGNGQLVGYAGGLWRKKWLLEHEAKMTGTYQLDLF